MATLLVRNAAMLVTMDHRRREIAGGGLFARDGWIEQVGPTNELPETGDLVLDLTGHVVGPGLVNTHHHLYQTLTRAVPAAQDAPLFDWLRALYPVWARMSPDDVRTATTLGLVELAMSGCTTAFDHHYLWPNGARVDDQIDGAGEVGIRFHASRGSMSLGESSGGLPPDSVVEDEDAILEDCVRVVTTYHDPAPGAMTRIVIAPCSPFTVTPDLMRRAAALARELGVRLHTHLAETRDEEEYCLDRFDRRPIELAADLGWMGDDVWFAHAVHVSAADIEAMAGGATGVAHCPTSNMRLASGIAPVAAYLSSGVPVGLGVDGSASNDSSHMLAEARQTLLVARLGVAPEIGHQGPLMTARTVLELATRGGAGVLGRDDIGALEVGKAADLFAVRLDRLDYAGAVHDPVAALVFCTPGTVDHLIVHGRPVIRDGRPLGLDLEDLIARHNDAARRVATGL